MTLTKVNRKDSDGEEKVLTLITSCARRYLETWHYWRDSRGKYVSRWRITAYVAGTWGTFG
jgi:hypothetical protein